MITKTQIIDIIHRHGYNVEDQAGNHLIVVDDDDWDKIAQEIVEILPIADVVGQSEQFVCVCYKTGYYIEDGVRICDNCNAPHYTN